MFESDRNCLRTYYAIRPDGSGLRRLFSLRGCGYAYWKPDGTKALVIVGRGIGPYILDLRSGKRHPLQIKGLYNANNPPGQPWSPDGKRLLLATGTRDFSVADRDFLYSPRTHDWPTLDTQTETYSPAWAADGKSVIFPTVPGIAAAGIHGGVRTIVRIPESWDIESVGASSNGKWISFVRESAPLPSLYVVRSNGHGLHRIARAVNVAAWSPTGERLSYQDSAGLHIVDPESQRAVFVVGARGAMTLVGPPFAAPVWSPDGRWLLYVRKDLGFGAPSYAHDQIWVVRTNGRDAHSITQAFPGVGNLEVEDTAWIASNVTGKPVRHPPFVEPRGNPVVIRGLPIVALGALGQRVVVATGFGRQPSVGVSEVRAPRGPIVRIGPGGRTSELQLPRHCVSVSSLVLTATRLGYVCDNSVFESARYGLWLGGKRLVSTKGGPGTGTYLGGPATDGRTIAYSVNDNPIGGPPHYKPLPRSTRIYEVHGSSVKLVRTLHGSATLESIDSGRIALLRYGRGETVEVLSPRGSVRKFRFHVYDINGVALDGGRLLVLERRRLVVVDLATGRRHVWRTALPSNGYGPQLASVRGDLVAYVVGAAVHVMRLSDGHEVVIDTPGATDPVLAQFVGTGLFYAYNEAYAKDPGRVGFLSLAALEHAISAKGRLAR